ncbi:hypothetical protein HS7_05570 [Sulfolobales archaeon HS-7]|nr:hypothetical protein HS7_05570 [Sulfolobales archaeon HS-7]
MEVSAIVQRNRIDNTLRSGIELRLRYAPKDIRYRLVEEFPKLGPEFNDYVINSKTVLKWVLKLLGEPILSLRLTGIVHSFFLNAYLPRGPWVQELDQPLSNVFSDYLKIGSLRERVIELMKDVFNMRGTTVIGWTNWCAKGLREEGIKRVEVLPPPITPTPKEISNKTIAYIGVDYERKGGDIAEAVFERLPGNVRKVFVGNTPRERDGVEYVEKLPHSKIIELLRDVDLLIFPSRKEAYGITVLEAMSMGIPVVTSDYGPLPEVASNNLKCSTDDIGCFINYSKELLYSEDFRTSVSKKEIEVVTSRNSPEILGSKLKRIYQDIESKSG